MPVSLLPPVPATASGCLEAVLTAEDEGRWSDAEELATYGLDGVCPDPEVRVALLRALGRSHARAGRLAKAQDVFARVALVERGTPSPRDVAALACDAAGIGLTFTSVPQGRIAQLRSALESAGDEPVLRAHLLALLATATYYVDLDASRALVDEAWGLVSSRPAGAVTSTVRGIRAVVRLGAPTGVTFLGNTPGARLTRRTWPAGPAAQPPRLDPAAAPAGPATRASGLLGAARLSRAVMAADRLRVARLGAVVQQSPSPDVRSLGAVAGLLWQLHTAEPVARERMLTALPTVETARLGLLSCAAFEAYYVGADHVPALRRLVDAWRTTPHRQDLSADLGDGVHALASALLEDADDCVAAARRLAPLTGRMLTVAGIVAVGPADWFLAWARHGAGERQAALAANASALVVAQASGATAWVAHALLQRAALLRPQSPAESAAFAEEAAGAAAAAGLPALEAKARASLASDGAVPRGARGRQILDLAARGYTNDEIAASLDLSVWTVQRHCTQLYRRLGVRNRAEAVAVARRTGLVGAADDRRDPTRWAPALRRNA